jgi:hypothetical protein
MKSITASCKYVLSCMTRCRIKLRMSHINLIVQKLLVSFQNVSADENSTIPKRSQNGVGSRTQLISKREG